MNQRKTLMTRNLESMKENQFKEIWWEGGFVSSGAVPTHSLLKLHRLSTIVKWRTEPGLVEGIYNKME